MRQEPSFLDESGDTGSNLADSNQPIFVLGGLSIADKKWDNTKESLDKVILEYFDGRAPKDFGLQLTSGELRVLAAERLVARHD